jgi:phage terminase large subunit GpA-like protein
MNEAAMIADGYSAGLEALARAFEPKRPLSIPAWSDTFRWIGKPAAEPGPWRTSRIPFLRVPMEALDRRDPAPIVVFVKPSQVGGTELGLCWIGRAMHQQPTSFLALFPTDKVGRKWVRTKLRRMISATPALRGIVSSGRRAKQTSTVQEIHYPGGVFIVGSANNKDDLATVDAECVFFDEVDRMPLVLEGEGDPIELGLMRSVTFPRRKAFLVSSPTTEDASHIWPLWLSSTQERYHMPCPQCGERQVLNFDNLTWPDGKPKLAVYRCGFCENEIPEHRKTEMLAAGEWRAQFPERAESVRGFHINALCTPIGLGQSWPDHAAAWERARGKPARIQVFYNTRRGEPVASERIKLAWETVAGRREPYELRTIPKGILLLTGSADVQKDRIEVQIVGFGREERCAVIDYTVLEGDPTRGEVWKKVDDYFAAELLNSFSVKMRISCALVDAGNWQHEVTNFTRNLRARHIYASKGSSIASRQPIGRPTLVDVKASGRTYKRGAELYLIGVSALKSTLYARLDADEKALPADRHVRFPSALPDEYFRQLCAEAKTPQGRWEKVYEHNEVLDLFDGNIAAAMHHAVQVHRLRELDWQRLEQLYEPTTRPASDKPSELPSEIMGRFIPTRAHVGKTTE